MASFELDLHRTETTDVRQSNMDINVSDTKDSRMVKFDSLIEFKSITNIGY